MAAISVRALAKDDLKKRATVTPIAAPAPAPAPEPVDPMRGTIEAINQLVKAITTQQERPALSDFPTLPPETKPVRLEADVIRDAKTGKMQRIVITPVY